MWRRCMIPGLRPPQGSYPLLSMEGKDSETQIEPFYEFERRNKLDGGSVVEERCYATRKRLSANQVAATMQM